MPECYFENFREANVFAKKVARAGQNPTLKTMNSGFVVVLMNSPMMFRVFRIMKIDAINRQFLSGGISQNTPILKLSD